MTFTLFEKMFILDEGLTLKPYKCPAGKLTVGIGRNLESNPIHGYNNEDKLTVKQVMDIFHEDIAKSFAIARKYDWFNKLNEARQAVIVNILFIRPAAIKEWYRYKPELTKAIEEGRFRDAAALMRTLKIARQLRNRFFRLTGQFESGIWHKEYIEFIPNI